MRRLCQRAAGIGVALALACAGAPAARAQAADGVTQKLIQILVKNGVLTAQQAASLLEEAQREAALKHLDKSTATAGAPAASAKPVPDGSVRVTYVPETVRKQIAAEVKQQVMQQAQEEGWAEPNTVPGWAQRVRIYGDVRVRPQFDNFAKGNFPLFPDYNSINQSANGYDLANTNNTFPPLLNSTENRTRIGLRARVGVVAQIADWITTDIRIATGSNNSPISTNQVLGTPGEFQKYAVWLDRAYIDLHPAPWITMLAGRMPNPYWTSNLLFDYELNFDGFAIQTRHAIGPRNTGFLTLGAFPVFNTAFSFDSASSGVQQPSRNAWLLAAQGGDDWRITDAYEAKFVAGYFDFVNLQGKLSSPCLIASASAAPAGVCDTDITRAPLVSFGNTLFPIRSIDQSNGSVAQPEFYGLASRFGVLDLHGQLTYHGFRPVDVALEGDYADNLAFNRSAVLGKAAANAFTSSNGSAFSPGGSAYAVRVAVGHLQLAKAWDWNSEVAYKYLSTDSVLDALTDSHFHLGGTNAKGYQVRGNLALSKDFWLAAELDSTNVVTGPQYTVNTLFLEMNARF